MSTMDTVQYNRIKKRIKKRKAFFDEIDLLVIECDYQRNKASEYHFLLNQIWREDPILQDGPDTLAPDELPPQEATPA